MNVKKTVGIVSFFLLMGSIWLANYFISHIGVVCETEHGPCLIPIFPNFQGSWILAPSGVLMIGLGFTFRDMVQRFLGVKFAALSILFGAVLSAWINPYLAVASGTAFLISEFLDLAVYTPLQEKHLTWAVVASNFVGLVVDSVVFLTIAFGSLAFIEGQVLGKLLMIPVGLVLIHGIRWIEFKYQTRRVVVV